MNQVDLDCRGLACPMPIVRLSRAMKELGIGDTLVVTANDPSFKADVEAWARRMGQEIASFQDIDGVQTAELRKSR